MFSILFEMKPYTIKWKKTLCIRGCLRQIFFHRLRRFSSPVSRAGKTGSRVEKKRSFGRKNISFWFRPDRLQQKRDGLQRGREHGKGRPDHLLKKKIDCRNRRMIFTTGQSKGSIGEGLCRQGILVYNSFFPFAAPHFTNAG